MPVLEPAPTRRAPRVAPPAPPAAPPRGGERERREELMVRVKMLGDRNRLASVTAALASIEQAIVKQHVEDVVSIISEAGGLDQRQRRAARRQVRRLTRSALPEVRNGSLVFDIVLVSATFSVCKWILDKTLGSSVTQAWKDSEAGKRVTEQLRKLFDTKIPVSRRDQVLKALEAKRRFGELDVRSLSREEKNAINLTVEAPPPPRIPGESPR